MASDNNLEQIKRELNFITRTLSGGYIDEEAIREMFKAAQSARASLEAHELSLEPEIEDSLAA